MILPLERRLALSEKAKAFAGNVEQVLPYLLSRGITDEVAAMFSLGCAPEGNEYAGRLTIPYPTPNGVVQIKYRCSDLSHQDQAGKHTSESCPKYLYESGTGTYLYNAQVLIYADQVVITEGELDAICVQAYTGIPAVAYPGTETWAKHPHYRLCFEGVSEIIVVADGDKSGKEAARKVAESIGLHARVVNCPSGQDSNSYIAEHGPSKFIELIKA